MLSTFTTEHGTLIIRTQDIRAIEDKAEGCALVWVVEGADVVLQVRTIVGTARENLERLQHEELEAIIKVQRAEQRGQQGLPALPIVRGGKALR